MKTTTMIALVPVCLFLAACSTTSTVQLVDGKYQTGAAVCELRFFKKSKPEGKFETLAQIESHVKKNLFFGGDAKLEDEAYTELKKKGCAIGGNAIVINDYVESRAAEFSDVHVWATVIKLF